MLNLFGLGSNAFARKRKSVARPVDTVSAIESLESRIVLASQVSSLYSNGNLTLSGSGDNDNLIVSITGTNTITLTTGGSTAFTGAGAGPFVVTGNLTINLGNGSDTLLIRVDGTDGDGVLDSGNVSIDLGAGNDIFSTQDDLTFTGNVAILGGTGNDSITIGSSTSSVSVYKLDIDSGVTTPSQTDSKFVTVNSLTAGSNVTIKNSTIGSSSISLGTIVANSIGGNLSITQSAVGSGSGYFTTVTNTGVAGNFSVTHGNSTGPQSIAVTANAGVVTVGGTTTLANGQGPSNSVTVTGTGATFTLAKNVTVANGNATGPSTVALTDVAINGSSSSFTNGTGTSNLVSFSGVAGVSFAGAVAVTNGNSSGVNIINANHITATKGITLTNGNASSNNVSIGGASATDTAAVAGNVVITNKVSTTNFVNIDRLTTTGKGNVTIANGVATGTNSVTIGTNGANLIDGNIAITNQGSAVATRFTLLNNTTVNGRAGLTLNNVGAGNSNLSIGGSSAVTIVGAVTIQDGTGSNFMTFGALNAGSLNYTDLGGGTDNVNIGSGGGATTINGVTRINTGNGQDSVFIGSGSVAVLNGLVSIDLGAGNDLLVIGSTASSPAFSTANNFRFDGGQGSDTFSASPVSLADYVPGLIIGKLKSKISGFETLI